MNQTQKAEMIYQSYPRKVGKIQAIKAIIAAYKRLIRESGASAERVWEQLLERTQAYAMSDEGRGKLRLGANPDAHTKGIPYPGTWFNAGRYDDDPDEWMNPENRGSKPKQQDHEAAANRKRESDERERTQLAEESERLVQQVMALPLDERDRLKKRVVERDGFARRAYAEVDPLDSPRLCALMMAIRETTEATT